MAPDPVAVRISRGSYRSYDEVRRALRALEANGWTPADAADLVEDLARHDLNVLDGAHGAIQLRHAGDIAT